MNTRTLKSLNEAIAKVASPVSQSDVAKGFVNSLTGKARQVYSSINEEKEEDEDEKEETPAQEKAEDKAEMLMKRLAAKALKRAKKKARKFSTDDQYTGSKPKAGKTDLDMKNARMHGAMAEEVELAEKAAPGYEDWASDPKVKASFKKQYGNRWKQVMYAKSWKMSKMDEENEQLDEEWGGGFQSFKDAHREVQAGLRREASANRRKLVADIKAVFSGKMTKHAFTRKHKIKFGEHTLAKRMAASRAKAKAKYLAKKAAKASAPKADSTPSIMEGMQLDEAGYKRLMRLKKAAYTAQDKAHRSFTADQNKPAKLARAAAEREAQVAAGMARRGGASPDAVRGGGSRIGPSGKYTQKAGALANQRDKALAKFRARAGYNKAQGMSRSSTEKQISRNTQQFQDDIRNRSRSGDFGQDNQAALRARSNFQKRYGRLKGK